MDLFSQVGEFEEPEEPLEPSPDEVFSNGASDDFADDSFDADADIEEGADEPEEDFQEVSEAPVEVTPAPVPQVEPEPVQAAPVAAPIASTIKPTTPTKEPATMSELTSELLNLSDAEFAALVKAREEKKKEGLKAEKLVTVQKSLETASYDELAKVEAFVRGGYKGVSASEAKAVVNEVPSASTRTRFDLKPAHTVETLVAALAKGNDYKVNEILQAVGVVKGMDLNGAATFDAYVLKYKTNVLKKAVADKLIATSGEKTLMTYFLV